MIDLVFMAEKFFGIRYVWAGNTPEQGMDCSGMVCECLRSIGLIGKADYTAQMLHDYPGTKGSQSSVERNSLLFFGKDTQHITHVAIAIDQNYMYEAGGEGSRATTNGYVRIRPITNRSDLVAAIKIM